jgi:hypothetical protein
MKPDLKLTLLAEAVVAIEAVEAAADSTEIAATNNNVSADIVPLIKTVSTGQFFYFQAVAFPSHPHRKRVK